MPDDIDQYLQGQSAANGAAGYEVQPQAAVDAIHSEPASGIPASIGMHNVEQPTSLARVRRDADIIASSPEVAAFSARSPAHATAVKDDLGPLASLASAVGVYTNNFAEVKQAAGAFTEEYERQTNPYFYHGLPVLGGLKDLWRTAQAGVGVASAVGQDIVPPLRGLLKGEAWLGRAVPAGIVDTIGPGYQPGGVDLKTGFTPPRLRTREEGIKGWQDTFSAALFAVAPARGGPLRAAAVVDEGLLNAQPRLTGPVEPIIDAEFEDLRPPGVNPAQVPFYSAVAETDAQALEGMQEATAATATRGRSPALTAQFIEQANPGAKVYIPPQVLTDLVTEGKDVPGFDLTSDAIQAAILSGRDVEVPLGVYLASVSGKPIAADLQPHVRLRPEGVSVEEAKGLGGVPEPAAPVAEAAPKPELSIPADIPSDLHGPIRELSARAETAVDEIFKEQFLTQLFTEPAALGMTAPQFERYSNALAEAKAVAHERLLNRTYNQIRRERTPEWKNEVAQQKALVEGEVTARRDIRARQAIQYSEGPRGEPLSALKINKADVVSDYGEGTASALPSSMFGRGGYTPDEAASLLGYDSGEELLSDLLDLEAFRKDVGAKSSREHLAGMIEGLATQRAREALGYDISPEGLAQAAREAVTEGPVEDFLTGELRALAKQAGKPPFNKADVQAAAEANFDLLPLVDATTPAKFTRGMWTNGTRIEEALSKGNFPKAFDLRQAQYINYLQLKMSFAAQKKLRANNGVLNRWAKAQVVPNTDHLVGAILQRAAEGMGFRLVRDGAELDRYLAQAQSEGRPFDVPSLNASALDRGEVIDNADGPPSQGDQTALSWGDYVAYTDQLKALQKFGATLSSITAHGKAWKLLDFGNTVAANADAIGRKYTPQQLHDIQNGTSDFLKDVFNAGKMTTQSLFAANLRPEVYYHWVDGGKQGPLMGLVNELQEAKYTETDLSKNWVAAMKAAVPSKFWGQMKVKLNAPSWMAVDTPHGMVRVFQTRGNLRYGLTYLGSESARAKLFEGFGWNEGIQKAAEEWMLQAATTEDWQFVKAFWAENEKLFKLADAKYMARRGYGLKADITRPVATGNPNIGTLPGGHVHVTYNSGLTTRTKITLESGLKAVFGTIRPGGNVMNSFPASRLPSAFYTQARTGYKAPVNLDPRTISSGVAEVIHDIAYRDALINAQKGLTHPMVKDALEAVLGPEYAAQTLPWLTYIAQQRMLYDPSTAPLVRFGNRIQSNASFALLAFNVSSPLKHAAVGLSHVAGEVGPTAFTQALSDLTGTGPKAQMWRKFVEENSGEIRGLRVNTDANMGRLFQQNQLTGAAESAYRDIGYTFFTIMKAAEAYPTWLGKYRTAMGENGNHKESVAIANKAVRDTQGAGHPVDLAPFLRRTESPLLNFLQIGPQFAMGFRSTSPNRMFTAKRQIGRGVRQAAGGELGAGAENIGNAAKGTLAWVILPALILAAYEVFVRGGGSQKAKTAGDKFTEELGWALMENSAGSLVGVNSVVDSAKFGNANVDKMKAAAAHVDKGEFDQIKGAWRLGLGAFAGLSGWIPAEAGNLIQAIADKGGDDLQPDEHTAASFFQRAVLGRSPHYIPTHRRSHR